ncbi:sensor histidine kinase [Parasphingorhabdus pacifica]
MPSATDPDSAVERSALSWTKDEHGGAGTRGLLHDLGHGLATLSYLSDGLHEDPSLSPGARERVRLMRRELEQLLELADRGLRVRTPVEWCDLREVAGQLVTLTSLTTSTLVHLLPGPGAAIRSDRSTVRRMLGNVLDNAVRAAGPEGTVEVTLRRVPPSSTAVEIVDDGPGLGRGVAGTASLGLGIVTSLARTCGANVHIGPAGSSGTRARLTFPEARTGG